MVEVKPIPRILVVDDDPALVLALTDCLQWEGMEAIGTTQLNEAEYALTTGSFDVVVTDVRFSESSGREGLHFAEYLRTRHPGVHIIVMTGYGTPEIKATALHSGAVAYLEKPFSMRELTRRIRITLNPTAETT